MKRANTDIGSSVQILKEAQLIRLYVDPYSFSLHLLFDLYEGESICSLECSRLLHWVFSKTPDEEEGCFLVLDVSVTEIEDGGLDIFKRLGYGFYRNEGEPVTYPERKLYHLHIEGDVCLDVVCFRINLLTDES